MNRPFLYTFWFFLFANLSVNAQSNLNFIDIRAESFSYWFGPDSWIAKSNFIQFGYEDRQHGWARIIFYPKNIKEQNITDSLDKSSKRDDNWIRPYVLKNSIRFDVWAIFVDKKYDKDKRDAGDITVFEPTYPCRAELYKLYKNKWILVKATQIIKHGDEFKLFPHLNY